MIYEIFFLSFVKQDSKKSLAASRNSFKMSSIWITDLWITNPWRHSNMLASGSYVTLFGPFKTTQFQKFKLWKKHLVHLPYAMACIFFTHFSLRLRLILQSGHYFLILEDITKNYFSTFWLKANFNMLQIGLMSQEILMRERQRSNSLDHVLKLAVKNKFNTNWQFDFIIKNIYISDFLHISNIVI